MLKRLQWKSWPSNEQAYSLRFDIEACARAIEFCQALPLPPIPVTCTASYPRRGGYIPQRDVDEQGHFVERHIEMSVFGKYPRLTFAHEWGHYADNWFAGFAGYASAETDELSDILVRADDTTTVIQLRTIWRDPRSSFAERMEASRLLVPQEIWARSFAQYVALRSNDAVMQKEVSLLRDDEDEPLASLEAWEWSDFEGVAQAIDTFLRSKIW